MRERRKAIPIVFKQEYPDWLMQFKTKVIRKSQATAVLDAIKEEKTEVRKPERDVINKYVDRALRNRK